jgi:hypothetical protein
LADGVKLRTGSLLQDCDKDRVQVGSVTVEEQIDRLGFGCFQLICLAAFVALKFSDGMELAAGNFIWRGLPAGETRVSSYLRIYQNY